MFDITKAEKEAAKEIQEEAEKEAVKRMKKIMADIHKSKQVTKGLERELQLLKLELGESV